MPGRTLRGGLPGKADTGQQTKPQTRVCPHDRPGSVHRLQNVPDPLSIHAEPHPMEFRVAEVSEVRPVCGHPIYGRKGGPGGTQACVKVCPVNAITFTTKMPDQGSKESYFVNLRGRAWSKLGMTTQ